MRSFFISDLHLQASRPTIAEAFNSFVEKIVLEYQAEAAQLFILGDFFDAWVGDDEDDPFYTGIKNEVANFSKRGLNIFFQHGNRDFLVGEKFAEETGLTLIPEKHCINLEGEDTLLMHGDSLCVDDKEYMQFRQQVRNPAWQQQILQLPLEQRRAMAAQLREQSQSMNAMKAEDIMDVNEQEVEGVLQDAGVNTLIHGHTHRPAVHELSLKSGSARRMVLGDWDIYGWYICHDEHGLRLEKFTL
ncbi:UDP-2,3-diacylglucosamine hydrolase [Alteromonadaceae bacterium Bs31]|nr:UDP-2,3-diacylglucosamine hydrolase [Alteromonadaceae bacterium Bs31]